MQASDHNPYLAKGAAPDESAAKGTIDRAGHLPNMVWQTRPAAPTAFENQLGDLLESIFDSGVTELDGVVAKLNESGLASPAGGPWTVASFTAELARLGA